MAQKIISEINFGSTAIVAVLNNAVIGFALLGNFLFVMKSNILICQNFMLWKLFVGVG